MALGVTFALLGACSGSSKKSEQRAPVTQVIVRAPDGGVDTHIPTLSGPARLLDGRYYVDQGAPHPLSCQDDKDCIGDTVPDDTGCCVRSSEPFPQTWAWHTWSTERRLSQVCDKVTCPPLPVPSMPNVCKLNVKCARGACQDTCSEQPQDQKQQGKPDAGQK